MIFDGENMFYNKADLTGTLTSDVVDVGPGETYQPMFLAVLVKDANAGATITATLQTSADAAFTTPVTLATMTKAGTQPVPRGNLGYLRLQVEATATAGTLTAGLVVDDDIAHRQ